MYRTYNSCKQTGGREGLGMEITVFLCNVLGLHKVRPSLQLEVFSEDTPRAALWYTYNCVTKWP